MTVDGTTALALAVLFLATFIRSAFGFGEALVSVPLLAMVIPVEVAVPLATLHSVTVAAVVLAQDWRKVHIGPAWRLVAPTLAGIPLGLLVLTSADQQAVRIGLAVVIVSFSVYCLVGRRELRLTNDRLAWVFGFGAGVLGGAYGINGPPLVVYGSLRRWTPEHFRATLQGYFLPSSLAGLCGFWLAGLWPATVTRYYLLSLPLALVAIPIGRAANRRMSGDRFHRYVHLGLIAIGILLFVQTV